MNYTDKTKTLRLDSTLSLKSCPNFKLSSTPHDYLIAICVVNPEPIVLAILENGMALVIPKFCAVRTVINIFIFSFALIDILVGLVVQSALLEKSTWVFFFFFFFTAGQK